MAIIKSIKQRGNDYNSKWQLQYLMTDYLVKDIKTPSMAFSGINVNDNPIIAFQEMMFCKNMAPKRRREDDREYLHFVQSFSIPDSNRINPEIANLIANELVKSMPELDGFQVSLVTHEEKKHLHTHIIINTVNPNTLKKINFRDIDVFNRKLKEHNDIICGRLGLSVLKSKSQKNNIIDIIKDNGVYKGSDRKTREARKYKSLDKDKIAKDVFESINSSRNKFTFIKDMIHKGYIVDWQPDKTRVSKKTGNTYTSPSKIKITNPKMINPKTGKPITIHLEKIFSEYQVDYTTIKNVDILKHFELIENNKKERYKDDSVDRAYKAVENIKAQVYIPSDGSALRLLSSIANLPNRVNNEYTTPNTKTGVNDIFKRISKKNNKKERDEGYIY